MILMQKVNSKMGKNLKLWFSEDKKHQKFNKKKTSKQQDWLR